jgi:NADH dehydrogenase
MNRFEPAPPRIVIVGGGAGGLELATRLGDTIGRRRRACVSLVERERTHLWKPLLHQAAAGTLGVDDAELDHLAQASRHHYAYRLGAMDGIDRTRRLVHVAPTRTDDGRVLIARRELPYELLVVAIGSRSEDFGVRGAAEHAITLDTAADAARLQRRLLDAHIAARTQRGPLRPSQLEVVIVGGGATGVELAAELRRATRALADYGLDRGQRTRGVHVTLLEAAARLLPPLPPRLSHTAAAELQRIGVSVRTGQRVDEVRADGVATADGDFHPAEIVVWAAGIRAPAVLRELDGLELDDSGRLVVGETLQTTRDPRIFGCGDCAACPWPGHAAPVPPRAQAAQQQAALLARQLPRELAARPLLRFVYRDFGSLVSLGAGHSVGALNPAPAGASSRAAAWLRRLAARLLPDTLYVRGRVARLTYWLLSRRRLCTLHGWRRMLWLTLAQRIARRIGPRVKLH